MDAHGPAPSRAPAQRIVFDVGPGSHVGPFRLGQSLNQTITLLESEHLPAEVAYSPSNLLDFDVQLTVARMGIRLSFHSSCQRLAQIDVYNMALPRLLLNRQYLISAPEARLTLEAAARYFGPSQAGFLQDGAYVLPYQGLSVAYALPSATSTATSPRAPRDRDMAEVAARLLATTLTVSKRPRHPPPDDDVGITPHLPDPCIFCDSRGDVCARMYISCEDPRALRVGAPNGPRLAIGQSSQDVLAVLGSPQREYVDARPPLAVGTPSLPPLMGDEAPVKSAVHNYFYNYFRNGLDVMLDGNTHRVLKFVFHTNIPGHESFGLYEKADFIIETLPDGTESSAPLLPATPPLTPTAEQGAVGDLLHIAEFAPKSAVRPAVPVTRRYDPVVVDADTRWYNLKNLLGRAVAAEAPIVLDMRDRSRFQRTTLHGHANLIFEIVDDEHIASVTVF